MGEREQTLGLVPEQQQDPEAPIRVIKKTSKMLRVEKYTGDLGEFLRFRCAQEDATFTEIAREIGEISGGRESISPLTVKKWIKKFGISFTPLDSATVTGRRWEDSGHRIKVQEGMRRFWSDPEKKEEAVRRIWSPEARKKRRRAIERYWQAHPGERKALAERWAGDTRRRREERKEEKRERIRQAFGENPAQELTKLRRRGLIYKEIGEMVRVSSSTVSRWAKELGVTAVKRGGRLVVHLRGRAEFVQRAREKGLFEHLGEREREVLTKRYLSEESQTLEEVGRELGGYTRERIRQIEARAIQKLQEFSSD